MTYVVRHFLILEAEVPVLVFLAAYMLGPVYSLLYRALEVVDRDYVAGELGGYDGVELQVLQISGWKQLTRRQR